MEIASQTLEVLRLDRCIRLGDLGRNRGYSPAVVTMVDLLTHDKHRHTYRQYVQHIKNSGNAGAIKIKLSDNADNSAPSRHTALNPLISQGLLERYSMARQTLLA
jgi:hypothetical protein